MNEEVLSKIANFIYEAGMLSKTPRSGLWYLGSGSQSVAEHLNRTTYIAYALCHLVPEANRSHVLLLALFHDFAEGRTSDLNYVHQKYGRLAEAQAFTDIAASVPFGHELQELYQEEQARETLEAKLVKDADTLDWLATMREEEEKGNQKAKKWALIAFKRLKTEVGKFVGAKLMETHPDAWWFDENDSWFLSRGGKDDTAKESLPI